MVPSTVASRVEKIATMKLLRIARSHSSDWKKSAYQRSE
jgi:hypothetical protein